jgi:hypothetical protein
MEPLEISQKESGCWGPQPCASFTREGGGGYMLRLEFYDPRKSQCTIIIPLTPGPDHQVMNAQLASHGMEGWDG